MELFPKMALVPSGGWILTLIYIIVNFSIPASKKGVWQRLLAQQNKPTKTFAKTLKKIKAASTTLMVGFSAALISIVIGSVMGLLSGYLNGVVGEIFNGIINIFLLIPMLPLIVVLSAYFGAANKNIILIIALMGWCPTARAVRARVKQLKQMPFVEALIILGIPHRDIIFKHILPNIAEVVSARYILTVASCMLTEAAVSFLGLGDPVQVTWGGMVNSAFRSGGFVRGLILWYMAPGCCIMLCTLAFFMINQYLDSRTKLLSSNYLD